MIGRLLRQVQAFEEITLTCDRCERDVPLAYLHPCANVTVGFVCKLCLTKMSYAEFEFLRKNRP